MNFKERQSEYLELINRRLEKISAVPDNLQRSVFEAMRYSLMAGGKRIRPMLTLAVADLFGGSREDALLFGTALECIHTYSLIHDDLPCMDNDELRRGRPTCHVAYGESTALLAGDALLNLAFELMSDRSGYHQISEAQALRIIREVSLCSGAHGMIGGQVVDLACEGAEAVSPETLTYMHERKTGALIRVSAVSGAMVSGASEKEIEKISEFSLKLGLAFQIKDDILDFTGDEEVLGKPIGSDLESEKTTFVSLWGLEESQRRLDELTKQAQMCLNSFGERAGFLRAFSDYLLQRQN